MPRRRLRYRTERLEGDIEPDLDATKREAERRMAQVDSMPPDVRDLIHEFNVNPVVDAYQMGFTTVAEIRSRLRRQQRAWQEIITRGDVTKSKLQRPKAPG